MVHIENTTPTGGAKYHDRGNKSDYILENERWAGPLAKELGLDAKPYDFADYKNLLEGKSPLDEHQLGRAGDHPRGATTLVFSPPKSVSVAIHLLGDKVVDDCFDKAINDTTEWLQDNYLTTRLMKDGQTFSEPLQCACAIHKHPLSDAGDPQTHSHVDIMTVGQRRLDGEYRALNNEELYTNQHLIDQVFKTNLASNLKDRGIEIRETENGFEIANIPQALLDATSQRGQQIEEAAAATEYPNAAGSAQKNFAALNTRGEESANTLNYEEAITNCNERLTAAGFDLKAISDEYYAQRNDSHDLESDLSSAIDLSLAGREQESLTSKDIDLVIKAITPNEKPGVGEVITDKEGQQWMVTEVTSDDAEIMSYGVNTDLTTKSVTFDEIREMSQNPKTMTVAWHDQEPQVYRADRESVISQVIDKHMGASIDDIERAVAGLEEVDGATLPSRAEHAQLTIESIKYEKGVKEELAKNPEIEVGKQYRCYDKPGTNLGYVYAANTDDKEKEVTYCNARGRTESKFLKPNQALMRFENRSEKTVGFAVVDFSNLQYRATGEFLAPHVEQDWEKEKAAQAVADLAKAAEAKTTQEQAAPAEKVEVPKEEKEQQQAGPNWTYGGQSQEKEETASAYDEQARAAFNKAYEEGRKAQDEKLWAAHSKISEEIRAKGEKVRDIIAKRTEMQQSLIEAGADKGKELMSPKEARAAVVNSADSVSWVKFAKQALYDIFDESHIQNAKVADHKKTHEDIRKVLTTTNAVTNISELSNKQLETAAKIIRDNGGEVFTISSEGVFRGTVDDESVKVTGKAKADDTRLAGVPEDRKEATGQILAIIDKMSSKVSVDLYSTRTTGEGRLPGTGWTDPIGRHHRKPDKKTEEWENGFGIDIRQADGSTTKLWGSTKDEYLYVLKSDGSKGDKTDIDNPLASYDWATKGINPAVVLADKQTYELSKARAERQTEAGNTSFTIYDFLSAPNILVANQEGVFVGRQQLNPATPDVSKSILVVKSEREGGLGAEELKVIVEAGRAAGAKVAIDNNWSRGDTRNVTLEEFQKREANFEKGFAEIKPNSASQDLPEKEIIALAGYKMGDRSAERSWEYDKGGNGEVYNTGGSFSLDKAELGALDKKAHGENLSKADIRALVQSGKIAIQEVDMTVEKGRLFDPKNLVGGAERSQSLNGIAEVMKEYDMHLKAYGKEANLHATSPLMALGHLDEIQSAALSRALEACGYDAAVYETGKGNREVFYTSQFLADNDKTNSFSLHEVTDKNKQERIITGVTRKEADSKDILVQTRAYRAAKDEERQGVYNEKLAAIDLEQAKGFFNKIAAADKAEVNARAGETVTLNGDLDSKVNAIANTKVNAKVNASAAFEKIGKGVTFTDSAAHDVTKTKVQVEVKREKIFDPDNLYGNGKKSERDKSRVDELTKEHVRNGATKEAARDEALTKTGYDAEATKPEKIGSYGISTIRVTQQRVKASTSEADSTMNIGGFPVSDLAKAMVEKQKAAEQQPADALNNSLPPDLVKTLADFAHKLGANVRSDETVHNSVVEVGDLAKAGDTVSPSVGTSTEVLVENQTDINNLATTTTREPERYKGTVFLAKLKGDKLEGFGDGKVLDVRNDKNKSENEAVKKDYEQFKEVEEHEKAKSKGNKVLNDDDVREIHDKAMDKALTKNGYAAMFESANDGEVKVTITSEKKATLNESTRKEYEGKSEAFAKTNCHKL